MRRYIKKSQKALEVNSMKKVLGFPSVDTSCLMIVYIYKYIMLSVHFRKHAVFHIILLQKIM